MATEGQTPAPDVRYPRIIAANGPKMLALAGELADGALPAWQPPEFTAKARETLGPDKLLVVGLPVAPDKPTEAAAQVRDHLAAGADHVEVSVPVGTDFATGVDQLVALAPALLA
jgi:alkanesulfonate monooxygenase SsuD/methylene tetrahydromethanopterin reductase-like flavin-dependent oxidoreductase (luciferase family)